MKQTIIFAILTFIVIGCEKSSGDLNYMTATSIDHNGSPAKKDLIYMPLNGTWRLIEYWEDNGAGSGNWVTADYKEIISFDGGKFVFPPSFPLSNYDYKGYFTENDGFVYFFPGFLSQGSDTYRYTLESASRLVFYPLCRENCQRRYELVTDMPDQ